LKDFWRLRRFVFTRLEKLEVLVAVLISKNLLAKMIERMKRMRANMK